MRGLFLTVGLLILGVESAAALQSDLRAWLATNVVRLRTASPADSDFADLEPFVDAIGDRRVVMLGEPSHGAGTAFAMKARLTRFLHERMGFDVLVWESGFFDMDDANAAMRAGVDPTEAARLGVFTIWGDTREVRPLFEYIQATQDSRTPIEMAGFDMQFSGRNADERFAHDLRTFVGGAPADDVRHRGESLVRDLTSVYDRFGELRRVVGQRGNALHREGTAPEDIGPLLREFEVQIADSLAPRPMEYDRFRFVGDSLRTLIAESRAVFEVTHAPRRVDFMLRALGNYLLSGRMEYEYNTQSLPADGPERRALRNAQWNRRDTRNASNLIWLANEYYAGRKIVVWAHTGHIFDAHYAADWSTLSHESQTGGMTPTGSLVREELGEDLYRVAFVGHHGTDGLITTPGQQPIDPAPDGSLAALVHDLDVELGFIDLRGGVDGPPLPSDDPLGMRIRGYSVDVMKDWPRVIDAVVYIDSMAPATRWTEP